MLGECDGPDDIVDHTRYERVLRPGQVSQIRQFVGVVISGEVKGFLVEGRRDHTVHLASHRHLCCLAQAQRRGPAHRGVDLAPYYAPQMQVFRAQNVHNALRKAGLGQVVDVPEL